MSDQQGWGGDEGGRVGDSPTPPKAAEREFTDNELLRAIGKEMKRTREELKAIRTYTALTCLFAAVTAAFIAAWLTGLITIEFTPTSRGF